MPAEIEPQQEPEQMGEVEAEEPEVVVAIGLVVEPVAAAMVEFAPVAECIPVAAQPFVMLGPATAVGNTADNKGHIQYTAGNIADIVVGVVDTTVLKSSE